MSKDGAWTIWSSRAFHSGTVLGKYEYLHVCALMRALVCMKLLLLVWRDRRVAGVR